MTIEEKRRELFEAWADECLLEHNGIEYENPCVESAWNGFNAALDAVVIELPGDTFGRDEYSQGRDAGVGDCRDAIESTGLGLKVKP